ncbi:MAG: 2-C-methyl-D-erythritol 4-phosphate cytidylyltransferase [Cyclobacteriaceae bacterium]|nr:2-C-methyl-D-erythritol 4-phosphate cytidylyltransferase [Cyclobacteriaceae bacterium]
MKKYAVIVAGGKGKRMGSTTPKQYLLLDGYPILMHTLYKFYTYDSTINLILVLPKSDFDLWNTLCEEHDFDIPLQLTFGGDTRFQSVKNGLDLINTEGLVAIHDGVRPLVDNTIIDASFKVALQHKNAITAIPLKDSIRKIDGDKNFAEDRSNYQSIQTPQTFECALIKKAYTTEEQLHFTDDASVAEFAGHKIHLIEGSYKNIKITTTEDLKIAEVLFLK